MSSSPPTGQVNSLITRLDQMHIPAPGDSPRPIPRAASKQMLFSPRKMTVKETVKQMPELPPLDPHTETGDLLSIREFYAQCKARLAVKMQKKPHEERREKWLQSLVSRQQDVETLISQREESLQTRMKLMEEARNRIETQRHKPEVEELAARLSASDETRLKELAERLIDINNIVQGRRSRYTNARATVAQGILDLWRTSSTTEIIDDQDHIQHIHPTAHESIPVDEADTQKRFRVLFDLFLKHSGSPGSAPNTSGWAFVTCQRWGESIGEQEGIEADRLLSQSLLEKVTSEHSVSRLGDRKLVECEGEHHVVHNLKKLEAVLEAEPNNELYLYQLGSLLRRGKPGLFNKMMERFLRSCIQSTFTGSLAAEDILKRAPNREDSSKNLYAHVPTGAMEIQRVFYRNHSSQISIRLPCNMKINQGEKRGTHVATFVVTYTIFFDTEMTAHSITCKASPPKFLT